MSPPTNKPLNIKDHDTWPKSFEDVYFQTCNVFQTSPIEINKVIQILHMFV